MMLSSFRTASQTFPSRLSQEGLGGCTRKPPIIHVGADAQVSEAFRIAKSDLGRILSCGTLGAPSVPVVILVARFAIAYNPRAGRQLVA
jgi:hypothetical protein